MQAHNTIHILHVFSMVSLDSSNKYIVEQMLFKFEYNSGISTQYRVQQRYFFLYFLFFSSLLSSSQTQNSDRTRSNRHKQMKQTLTPPTVALFNNLAHN